jgi:hypothetical protein
MKKFEAHEEASGPLGGILLKANAVTQAELAGALQAQASRCNGAPGGRAWPCRRVCTASRCR